MPAATTVSCTVREDRVERALVQEDLDRELDEFLGEVRVVLPAVTVLFAFLLTVPFTARFQQLTLPTRTAYFVAFLTTGIAIVLLVGETGYHRLRGKPYDKARMLRTATRQTIGALALIAVGLSAVVYLVTAVLYGAAWAAACTAALALLALVTWFVLPLTRRQGADREG
jgi:amino acid transporter